VANAVPQPSRSIASLRREQAALQRKLASMLNKGVKKTSSGVAKVLAVQAHIASKNEAEIRRALSTDDFDPAKAPAFHSKALDKPLHVASGRSEVEQLEHELASKIAATHRLAEREAKSDQHRKVHAGKQHAAAAAVAAGNSIVMQTPKKSASLDEVVVPPAASVNDGAQAYNSDEAEAHRTRAWESPRAADSVPYEAMRDDALPAARDSLITARHRVTARLSAQLQNAKERLERFRSHWSVHMPQDLRRATDEGWTSRYAKDYMSQGKTRSDLSSEENLIEELSEDREKTAEEREQISTQLRDAEEETRRLRSADNDLALHVREDERDINLAQRNAAALRQHLPEYYDDLSDTDYESYHPHVAAAQH